MKLLTLAIQNIGLIVSEIIKLDKPLLVFYGEIQQGKTTILNSVRYVFGGSFPTDLLRHGEKEGFIRLDFEGGYILREFYRADDGVIKSRPLVFEQNGKRVPRPVEALKKFLNPFLLDQDHLARMSELERRKYFTELFNVNTDALDAEEATCGAEAQGLRAEVKAYGEIDLTKFERVNVQELQAKLHAIRQLNSLERDLVSKHDRERDEHNANVKHRQGVRIIMQEEIADLREQLAKHERELLEVEGWLNIHPLRGDVAEPDLQDTSELESRISTALADNVRAEIYEGNCKREDERREKNVRVSELEARQREIFREKEAKLLKLSAECGVPSLKFLPKGDFEYQNTRAGMLSTSQLMELSAALSALYPNGFGLDLIDRAESLGKAVFEFVERAKAEHKTILATVVGERPAAVPADVGVFIVEGGKIS